MSKRKSNEIENKTNHSNSNAKQYSNGNTNGTKLKQKFSKEVDTELNGNGKQAVHVENRDEDVHEEGGDSYSDNDEDDDEDEEDDEEEQNSEPKAKKAKRENLTAQEIRIARETAELFKSNIFKLQIDELLKELKVKKSHEEKMEKVLRRLHDLIKQIPPVENLSLQQAENLFNPKKIVIPFPDPKPVNVKYTFSYLPPEDLSLVGSYGLKTGISQGSSIEVSMTMPSSLFQPKDYLNYRALYKRSFYLAYVAEHLISLTKKNNLPVKITYHYLNEDILNPVLNIESIQTENKEDLSFFKTKYTINLIAAFPFAIFDGKKLLPDKNCIRVSNNIEEQPATTLYNSSILTQSSYDYYLKYLYTMKKSTEAFKDACILGRLWLQQRGFGSSFSKGGFGHFEFAILLAALLQGGGVNSNKILLHGFSSYQLFKGAIQYLATMDLNKGYLSFSSLIGEEIPSKYKSDGFNIPTIFDKNTKLNILYKMTTASYEDVKAKANQTLDLLNEVVKDRFDPILLQRSTQPNLKYDITLSLTLPDEILDTFGALEKITFLTFNNFFKHKLYNLIKTALEDRATLIRIENDKVNSTFAIQKRKPANGGLTFNIGLQLNSDESDKLVTKGPNNEDKENGTKFRSFWGSKATLRRFKDGSIQNCVVWPVSDREPIVVSIIRYVLDLHILKDLTQSLHTECGLFDKILPLSLLPTASNQTTNSLYSFSILRSSFESLNKTLMNLELPLSIKSIMPASTALRYSSVLQPVPFAVSNPDFWNECILQFEISSRWPDELLALEKTKTAFLLKIADALRDTNYTTTIVDDHSIPFNEDIKTLNILTPEGFGFKIKILTERDELLYLRAVSNAGSQKSIAQNVYLAFVRNYQASVKHTRTITSLAQHFHYYSPTVRLVKQWLDSQLLLNHFTDELIELIVLKPFVDPAPYSIPHSVENGFLQVLSFLAHWNWKEIPLILDLVKSNAADDGIHSDKLSIQTYRIIEENFNRIRQSDPSAIKTQFFIGSKDDPSGILWSSELVLPIATRLTALARATIDLLLSKGIDEKSLNLIFKPALKDYDFTINVKSQNLTTSSGVLPPNTFKNLIQPLTSFPEDITSKYDLTQLYTKKLNEYYGNNIIFSSKKFICLNNQSGENVNIVGGLFVPSSLGKKKFRVNLETNVEPLNDENNEDEVKLNKAAIFDHMRLLGGELVTDLNVKK
ncbi:UTP22 [Candida pseudojiufengensis]|uniref:UTP22 n=1 Tax=Candida pseudojiufengensis TaxID=497109 RepID=UPI002224543A|nr:UTP22 [Candida pseudojiufengensis]KAI5963791.1 UTP22 [Candida pseudojiufengensis]